MLVRARFQSKPSSEVLSSTFIVIGSRLFWKASGTSDHLIMSHISYSPKSSIAGAPPQDRLVSRHSHCNWRREHVPICPSVCNAQPAKSCRFLARPFSREGCAPANICCSSRECWTGCVVPTRRSIRQRWRSEDECSAIISSREIRNCGAIKNHRRASHVSVVSTSSSPFRVSTHGAEIREQFRSRSKFHTGVRQEGRYICAPAQEESRFEDLEESWVDIHQENEIAREAEPLNDNAGDIEENKTYAPEIWVVNFYHFVCVDDPHLEVACHTSFLEGRDVRGRIYISHQGINAQVSGPGQQAMEYAEWVKEDPRFSNMLVQVSPSLVGHAFPRLRLRYKPSLVQVEGGTLHLPITDPSARAVQLTPREWTERLDAVSSSNDAALLQELGSLKTMHTSVPTMNTTRPVVLLDIRNGYEWDVGHFNGAQRPNVDCFKSTEFGLTESELVSNDPLANVDKEAVDVMMYCTGGIRCDVFSTMLRQKGFKNLYTLKGGVSNYLKEEGARKWAGNLFVFDTRLAVPPRAYRTKESPEQIVTMECDTKEELDYASLSASQTFARCRLCGDPISEPRHRNCANLDCNLLYMSCDDCLSQQKGCCSQICSLAPKLRPLIASQQYARWHNYRLQEPKPLKPADYVSRRALKRRRRKERRKQLIRDKAIEQLSLQ